MGIEFLSIKSIADGKITNDCSATDGIFDYYIPDYQRGYRWQPKQAIELLDDIWLFTINNYQSDHMQFYCIQPLVVDKDDENNRYDIVDGQQRLTTIYIILKCLGYDIKFGLEYQTRTNSKEYLEGITRRKNASVTDEQTEAKIKESRKNLDFYCMYQVSEAVNDWIDDHETNASFQDFKCAFLNNVQFIKYMIDKKDALDVFTRLNVGKIPLTSSELIKALLLNRSNFGEQPDLAHLKTEQGKIALKWDSIEYSLQNDEFWYFIHGAAYNRPTRIDYILDLIRINDKLIVKDGQAEIGIRTYLVEKYRYELQNNGQFLGRSSEEIEKEITKKTNDTFGDDEYSTFRYFNEYFNYCKKNNEINTKWLEELWKIIRDYFAVFDEWYHDYELYHYIGYLLATIPNNKKESVLLKTVNEYVCKWNGSKEEFKKVLKDDIKKRLNKPWVKHVKKATFEGNNKPSKRECYNLLLLHNIDTILVQNQKLIEDSKYELPNFSKFPFHLFHKQNQQSRKWEIEHIRPDSGDRFKTEDDIRVYLGMTLEYLNETYPNSNHDQSLKDIQALKVDIGKLLNEDEIKADNNALEEIRGKLEDLDDKSLSEEEKNMVWNYVLLDGGTNTEYGNKIFPIKRIFIKMKEQGEKPEHLEWDNGLKKDGTKEAAFITPCVKNVFSKFYTDTPSNMRNWTKDDAEKYLESIINMLERYDIKQE